MSQFASRAASSYLQTEVQSRTPLELVVMLYDGALRFLSNARSAIERNDIAARREAISRARSPSSRNCRARSTPIRAVISRNRSMRCTAI